MKKNNSKIRLISYAAIIAALYTALTLISSMMALSSGVIQVRLSEALTVLPVLTPAAVPGLAVGCLISNLITGCIPADVIIGTAATLMGAVGTRLLHTKSHLLSPIPPIIANTAAVPFILKYGYGVNGTITYFMLTVCIGEMISCGVLGLILYRSLKSKRIFKEH